MWVTLAAVGLNAALAWALIFGNWGAPELGAQGAALASLIVQAASFLALWAYAAWLPALRRFHLFQRFWRPDWAAFAQVQRLGWPIGLTSVAEGGLFHASALMMGWVGTAELAAHGIALEAASLAFMIHVGLSSAATIRVAGSRHRRGAALRQAAVVSILCLSWWRRRDLAVPACRVPDRPLPRRDQAGKRRDPAFGVTLLALAALFQLADAMQVMALGLLRASGRGCRWRWRRSAIGDRRRQAMCWLSAGIWRGRTVARLVIGRSRGEPAGEVLGAGAGRGPHVSVWPAENVSTPEFAWLANSLSLAVGLVQAAGVGCRRWPAAPAPPRAGGAFRHRVPVGWIGDQRGMDQMDQVGGGCSRRLRAATGGGWGRGRWSGPSRHRRAPRW